MKAGLSNIEAGVTIDLSALNQVVASEDMSIASISPGNRWRDVYEVLDPLNITVAGGRAASVGVGGFLTGGMSLKSSSGVQICLLTGLL
jgi:FAD/FMN-containing dehydrogenase